MFKISVSELLSSYSGDSQSFSFSGEVPDTYIEDIHFLDPLSFEIEIIALDDGVSVVFHTLKTRIEYEGKKYSINIPEFERTWKVSLDRNDPDDIREIESNMVDLAPVLREEIIMATHLS